MPEKKGIEKILETDPLVAELFTLDGVEREVEQNPWDTHAKQELAKIIYGYDTALDGDKGYPDAVQSLYEGKRKETEGRINQERKYSDYFDYDADSIKALLERLPPLKLDDKRYEKVAEAHKALYVTKAALKSQDKRMLQNPESFRDYVSNVVEDYKKHHAASSVSAARVASGLPGMELEYRRQLYKAIDELKPEKKK